MLFWIRNSAKRTNELSLGQLQRSAGQSYRGIGIAPPYSELLSWCHHEDVGMGSSAGL